MLAILASPSLTPSSACTINGQPAPCDQVIDQFGGLFLGFGLFFAAMFFLIFALAIAGFVLQILMIIHAAQNDIKDRAMWIVVMVLTGALGAIIYYFAVKQPFDRAKPPAVAAPSKPAPRRRSRKR
jgi:phospholipase D-like protein